MGYNRYIYSDATLKAKTANNKAGLLKNKKRSDIVAYGTELVLSQIKYEPKSYLEYGSILVGDEKGHKRSGREPWRHNG